MKKIVFALSLLIATFSFASCSDDDDDDKKVDYKTTPEMAQKFLDAHFDPSQIRYVEQEKNGSYDIKFNNNTEVDFTSTGEWIKIDMNGNPLPQTVAQLINTKCLDYISFNYPDARIEEIEKKGTDIEIEIVIGKKDYDILFDDAGNVKIDEAAGKKPEGPTNVKPEEILAPINEYLNLHFPNVKIRKIEKDYKDIEVKLENNIEIEFDLDGSFKKIEADKGAIIPESVFNASILDYIKQNYAGKRVEEYSKLPKYYQGELSGGYVVEFDGKPEIKAFFNKDGKFVNQVLDF